MTLNGLVLRVTVCAELPFQVIILIKITEDFTGSISRFLIKELGNTERKFTYCWQYLSFASLWISGDGVSDTQILLCFDLTYVMRAHILKSFLDSDAENLKRDPFEVYAILVDAITERYDEALWGFRIPVRDIEKV